MGTFCVLKVTGYEMKMENSKEIKLHDFYQACVLKTAGFVLLRVERNNSKFVEFVFADPDKQSVIILEKHWSGQLTLISKDLIQSIGDLKSRIYSGI